MAQENLRRPVYYLGLQRGELRRTTWSDFLLMMWMSGQPWRNGVIRQTFYRHLKLPMYIMYGHRFFKITKW